jgi:hypothetical protein
VCGDIKIGVIGIAREEISTVLSRENGLVPVPTSDIDASTRLQSGDLRYIIGACESGGGAALAIPIALLGTDRCRNLSRLGRPAGRDEIRAVVRGGVVAFGVARDHVDDIVATLADELRQVSGEPSK